MAHSKLDQLRALRERQFAAPEPARERKEVRPHSPGPTPGKPVHKTAAPVKAGAKPPFDRVAYQREYMRKRRAKPK